MIPVFEEAWAALLTHNISQLKYLQMQLIKGSSTLRVSPKNDKPVPEVVYRFGKQDGEIHKNSLCCCFGLDLSQKIVK